MAQSLTKLITVQEFLDTKPEKGRYELHHGAIVEMAQPIGEHEEVTGFLTIEASAEIKRLQLPYSIPKTALVQSVSSESAYSPDLLILNKPALKSEELWTKYSTVQLGASIPLIIEVVSTNWRDDYYNKVREYEEIGIPEYWIVEDTALDGFPGLKQVSVDYLGLGGNKFIGKPKQPTLSIYNLIDDEYQVSLFRGNDRIISKAFPELNLTAQQIFDAGN
ncbi:Uma2 family endonuclease [Rivularia sp. UHCC 0363]|uniref:Uma2 family endonuclease n=1 Tax=Rivularia sp. UHCC 0363 TaxID=3110244 RepID=UPI002B21DABC|nr:Uma2 family endonuclease [Rivularia sp. UHCC 0363]MEA5595496.1 Uma2 family endonuclease [Rivularia sp. UHCC 0363]